MNDAPEVRASLLVLTALYPIAPAHCTRRHLHSYLSVYNIRYVPRGMYCSNQRELHSGCTRACAAVMPSHLSESLPNLYHFAPPPVQQPVYLC